MAKTTVLVIGDYGEDIYHAGTVKGMSAEAPIPVVNLSDTPAHLKAMGGNVYENLRSLGVTANNPAPLSHHGPEKNRLFIETGPKQYQQIARWDENDFCSPLTPQELNDKIITLIDESFEGARYGIIICDYGKGAVTQELIDLVKTSSLPIFIDTKNDPSVWLGNTNTVLFPNDKEFARYKREYEWLPFVVHKQGAQGLRVLHYGEEIYNVPSVAKFVECVNGAGDTVLATFTWATLEGLELETATSLANIAAALVVEQPYYNRTTTQAALFHRWYEEQWGNRGLER